MSASAADPFTFIECPVHPGDDNGLPKLFGKYSELTLAKLSSPFTQLLSKLRHEYPDYVVTYANPGNLDLLAFAAAGFATATLDTESESVVRMRVWLQSGSGGSAGHLGEQVNFAKYHYRSNDELFIVYTIVLGYNEAQFILKERASSEGQFSHSIATDALLSEVGKWQYKKGIWVYDGGWYLDRGLYQQVQKASWDKVILDPGMKNELTRISSRFFDSKEVYDELGVPWKRGLIFYGPAGNGKTVSIKALMHTLAERDISIPTLYIKHAPETYHISSVFSMARRMSPCLLVLEDIDTIVTDRTRSYFFNEVDGLENNDGILMVASTNHLERLDPGLSKRPSRFDRKYLFPEPSMAERVMYVHLWQRKLRSIEDIEFPEKLVVPIADITHGFSFAYIQEAFVATLLEIAHSRGDDEGTLSNDTTDATSRGESSVEDLEKYELWRVIKQQVKMLRDEIGSEKRRTLRHTSQIPSNQYPEKTRSLIPGTPNIHPPL